MGLLTMGVGAFLFVPAASVPSYPLFLGCAYCSGGRDHLPAGSGESLCHGTGQAGDGFEPAESDASVQLARHVPWRLISVER